MLTFHLQRLDSGMKLSDLCTEKHKYSTFKETDMNKFLSILLAFVVAVMLFACKPAETATEKIADTVNYVIIDSASIADTTATE